MNKIIIPKHVEAGLFDMGVDIGFIRVKMWQLFIIAVGVAITFGIVNGLKKGGMGTIPSLIIVSPVILITLFVTFFRKSELYIIPFVIKLIRTYIVGTPKTFQRNTIKPEDYEIKIKYSQINNSAEQVIKQKTLEKDEIKDNLDVMGKY